jgi:hypothetical protein
MTMDIIALASVEANRHSKLPGRGTGAACCRREILRKLCFSLQPGSPFANEARGQWAHGSPEAAVIDGYSHVNIVIGILQQLYLDLVLLGFELDLICLHVGQSGDQLIT